MKSHNNQNNEIKMGIQPTKMQLYGRPQGNELVYGRLILRMIGPHRFEKVAYFDSYTEANRVFYEWMDEYAEYEYCDGEKK